jgi:RNA polymerase sigma factor (sigma-70 family)
MKAKDSLDALAGLPDDRLVHLASTGHPRAFEAIVHRYSRELIGYCARLGLTDSRAEDALQNSFMRAWVALERGTEVRELRPWLYRIVHNTALNAIRATDEDLTPLGDTVVLDALATPDAQVERKLAARAALADVAALPPMQRQAILMSAIDGHSREEVASALGLSDGAVRGLLYRARATLRAAAAAFGPAPLLRWATGQISRHAQSAGRAAETSAQGTGVEVGTNLMKGVAVAVVALGGGAAAVTLHNDRQHHAHTVQIATAVNPSGLAAPVEQATASRTVTTDAAHLKPTGRQLSASVSTPSSNSSSRPTTPAHGTPTTSTGNRGLSPAASAPTGVPTSGTPTEAATTARVTTNPTSEAPASSAPSETPKGETPVGKTEGGSGGSKEPESKPEEKGASGEKEHGSEESGGGGKSDDPEGSDDDPGGSGEQEGKQHGGQGKSDDGEEEGGASDDNGTTQRERESDS